jgi:hypothetical protein
MIHDDSKKNGPAMESGAVELVAGVMRVHQPPTDYASAVAVVNDAIR